jgi:hypothetical protein
MGRRGSLQTKDREFDVKKLSETESRYGNGLDDLQGTKLELERSHVNRSVRQQQERLD